MKFRGSSRSAEWTRVFVGGEGDVFEGCERRGAWGERTGRIGIREMLSGRTLSSFVADVVMKVLMYPRTQLAGDMEV